MWQLLFSFNGRIGRLAYWLASISLSVFIILMQSIIKLLQIQVDNLASISDPHSKLTSSVFLLVITLFILAVLIVYMWAALAVPAKRWHDRGKSAWWVLMGLIPIVGWIWTFVECGCLPGTPGANRYGASPDGPAEVAATFS